MNPHPDDFNPSTLQHGDDGKGGFLKGGSAPAFTISIEEGQAPTPPLPTTTVGPIRRTDIPKDRPQPETGLTTNSQNG